MDNFLNEINVKGVLYAISGGTGSGVTSGEVQTMLEEYTYDKETIDDKISSGGGSSSAITVLSGDVITISGDVISLSGDVQNISGDVIVLSGDVSALETKLDTLSGNVYTKDEVDDKIDEAVSGKTDFSDFSAHTANTAIHLTSGDVAAQMSAYTYDKETIDDKIASGGTFDPTLYYKKTETSGKTEIQNALNQKQDKLNAGRGIGIDELEIYLDFPIYQNGGIIIGTDWNSATGQYSVAEGYTTIANGNYSHAEGVATEANGEASHAEGSETKANGNYSHAEGSETKANGWYSHAEGNSTVTNNYTEHASGWYNNSSKALDNFGDSGNTLFSIGNGTNYYHEEKRHNALDIRENGDIYIADTNASGEYYEKPMIKLQDALGQGGGITSGDVVDIVSGYTYDKNTIDEKIDEATSGKADSSDVEELIDAFVDINTAITKVSGDVLELQLSAVTDAQYDSSAKTINFYNLTGGSVASIDATEFIKDGMIEDVQIVTIGGVSYLRITFNTESGHEDIDIDLSQIFDADNYYTKTEVYNKTEVDNKFWCGSESDWSQISGSTQSGVLYLIY